MVAMFRDQVHTYIVPLVEKLKERQRRRIGVDTLRSTTTRDSISHLEIRRQKETWSGFYKTANGCMKSYHLRQKRFSTLRYLFFC
jgi:hypothetical protein